jgi:hypothetical protein
MYMKVINFIKWVLGFETKDIAPTGEELNEDLSHLIDEDKVMSMGIEQGLEEVKALPLHENCDGCLFGVAQKPSIQGADYKLNSNYPQEDLFIPSKKNKMSVWDMEIHPATPIINPITGDLNLENLEKREITEGIFIPAPKTTKKRKPRPNTANPRKSNKSKQKHGESDSSKE